MNTNKYIHTCLAKKTPKDYRLKPSKSPVESPSCRHWRKNILSILIFYFDLDFIFPRYRPPFGECCVCPLSLFHFEVRVVCVWELVYMCAYEHKFGVATNHGKF